MIIEKCAIGRGKNRHNVYDVCNSIADTGADHVESIARFDTLEMAVLAVKYMRGDSLSEADAYMAREAIKKASAPTVESKRTRKAE